MVAVHASCSFRDKVDQITLAWRFCYSHFRIMERVYVLSLGKLRISADTWRSTLDVIFPAHSNISSQLAMPEPANAWMTRQLNDSPI